MTPMKQTRGPDCTSVRALKKAKPAPATEEVETLAMALVTATTILLPGNKRRCVSEEVKILTTYTRAYISH